MRRFLERDRSLVTRTSQTINRSRNSVSVADMDQFYNSLSTAINEHQLDETIIFNMDETAFDSRNKSQKVLALRGSKAVWSKSVSTSFHLSIVVCGNAFGNVVPPLFIFPGSELYRDLEDCDAIEGSAITTSNKGFITEQLFYHWIDWFSDQVGNDVVRPILLIMDNYGSHISKRCFVKCERLQVILLFLPENATHLVYLSIFVSLRRSRGLSAMESSTT